MPTRRPGASEVTPASERLDDAHDLVARHDRQMDVGQLAVDDVQIGAADAAGLDAHADLARAGQRIGPLFKRERLPGRCKNHCLHDTLPKAQSRRLS